MSQIFFREIDRLKNLLLKQGEKVENQVGLAASALSRYDSELAKRVIQGDDEIDQRDVDLQEECFKILALYQPVAFDLRFIVAVLKFNNDLERIADLAAAVAKRGIKIKDAGALPMVYDFDAMAVIARRMLRGALDALVRVNAQATEEVFALEKDLNRMHKDNTRAIVAAIRATPDQAEALIHQLVVSRHVERIGDLATNLAEEVIYIARGEIVRHRI